MGEGIYVFMVAALAVLAITDLVVGVSNDAVNFLNSALGSKAISFRTIMIVASIGIAFGAMSSSGMMEVARKGIFNPSEFVFAEIIVIFMAVMITDILLLDFFNTLGMPTSTTVSIVFELLGAAVAISIIKIMDAEEPMAMLGNYINTAKATEIIGGILLSVVIAFSVGALVQFLARVLITFEFEKQPKWMGSLFGGTAITAIIYFILVKGLKSAALFNGALSAFVAESPEIFLLGNFVFWSLTAWVLTTAFKLNVYKLIITMGTFALAMAFAGNDLVNFIGVPIAAFQSYQDWQASGIDPNQFSMEGLAAAVQTPTYLLLSSGIVMILTLWFSTKARYVTETEINLARKGEGEERFQPNFLSRQIVRFSIAATESVSQILPTELRKKVDKRFHKPYVYLPKSMVRNLPAFDMVRASVNLMMASILISMATSMKLPLSTTYVTFMVAMGSSLADRAWDAESAVYRVAGVLNVIGGWFITAFIAFVSAAIIALIIYHGGPYAVGALLVVAFMLIGKNYLSHNRRLRESKLEEKLEKAESRSIQGVINESAANIKTAIHRANKIYAQNIDGLAKHDIETLKKSKKGITKLNKEVEDLKDNLFYFIKNLEDPSDKTSTFYISILSYLQDITQSLEYMAKASHKHVHNNHKKLRFNQVKDLKETQAYINDLLQQVEDIFEQHTYTELTPLIIGKQELFDKLNAKIQKQVARTRDDESSPKNTALYFSLLLETKDLLVATMNLLETYDQHANVTVMV